MSLLSLKGDCKRLECILVSRAFRGFSSDYGQPPSLLSNIIPYLTILCHATVLNSFWSFVDSIEMISGTLASLLRRLTEIV